MSSVAAVLTLIAATAAAVAGVGYLARTVRRAARRATAVVDVILGTEVLPSLAERLQLLEQIPQRLQNLEHEMYPNSGKSLRDAINRIERDLGSFKRQAARNTVAGKKGRDTDREVVARLAARVDELKNQLDLDAAGPGRATRGGKR